ncbi:MipA/OmpV family protein [Ideonella sp. DXS22W]|uniref:MipA/OmpV family protein n=1 Tax=Pseudaquabacterium inlustre TaxID=2984192 RepID=A0ABU9CHB3_9BURK
MARASGVIGVTAAALCPAWAHAADTATAQAEAGEPSAAAAAPAQPAATEYALGLALVNRPAYAGSSQLAWKLRPLWTVKWGRYRLSGPRASGLLGRTGDEGSGASAELAEGAHWRLGASLGVDGGRSSGDDPRLAGLPDQRPSLRGKLYASRDLGGRWGVSAHVSQDLAGRGGGTLGGVDLGYSLVPGPGWRVSFGAGIGLADAQAMRHQFGIAPEVAARTGRTAYVPGSGLRDLHVGGTAQWAVSNVWFAFAGLGLSQLQSQAAQSPLVARRSSSSLALGLAWRNLP